MLSHPLLRPCFIVDPIVVLDTPHFFRVELKASSPLFSTALNLIVRSLIAFLHLKARIRKYAPVSDYLHHQNTLQYRHGPYIQEATSQVGSCIDYTTFHNAVSF